MLPVLDSGVECGIEFTSSKFAKNLVRCSKSRPKESEGKTIDLWVRPNTPQGGRLSMDFKNMYVTAHPFVRFIGLNP